MFTKLKSQYKKVEAGDFVAKLLDGVPNCGIVERNPSTMASSLIERIWSSNPDLFDGRLGKRPHKIAVAACALASGIAVFQPNSQNRGSLYLALLSVMKEIEFNASSYDFSSIDLSLIKFAGEIFIEETESQLSSPLGQQLSEMGVGAPVDITYITKD